MGVEPTRLLMPLGGAIAGRARRRAHAAAVTPAQGREGPGSQARHSRLRGSPARRRWPRLGAGRLNL